MSEKQSPFSLETGLKTMRLQALPCLHFPEKSHPKPSIPPRRIISNVETIKAVQKSVPKYETLCKNLSKYAIENWTFSQSEERFVLIWKVNILFQNLTFVWKILLNLQNWYMHSSYQIHISYTGKTKDQYTIFLYPHF